MGERVGQITKVPEVKKSSSNSRVRRTKRLQSMDTPADHILFLQRTAGNQAVQRLIKSGALQAKLRIGQPGDVYEQEADRVADAVMRMPEPGVQRQVGEEEEEEEMLQAKESSGQTPEVTSNLESRINAIRGGGQPLTESVRAFFEPRFGYDFKNMRVHTDTRAAESARSLNAKAFTAGRDIVFGSSQYSPDTTAGKKLLAHELTHVVQQSDSRVQPQPMIQCWSPPVHEKLTEEGVKQIFSGYPRFKMDREALRNLSSYSSEMDFKFPEIWFNLRAELAARTFEAYEAVCGGHPSSKEMIKRRRLTAYKRLIAHYRKNAENARNHGEGGLYFMSKSDAAAVNKKHQWMYELKAEREFNKLTWEFHSEKECDETKSKAREVVLKELGDALHVAQDRGAHGEGAAWQGHAKEIFKPGFDPDDKGRNSQGYDEAQKNTEDVLLFASNFLYDIFENVCRWTSYSERAESRIISRGKVKEAPRVVERVMRTLEPSLLRQAEEKEEEEELIQTKPFAEQITPIIQRQMEEEKKEEENIQAKETSDHVTGVIPGIESRITAIKGGDHPLPELTRTFFEPSFGYDFSQVRIHTDARAAESTAALNAQAFTFGRGVVFGVGNYAPGAKAGKKLLAHGLTHIVQQNGGDNVGLKRAPTSFSETSAREVKKDNFIRSLARRPSNALNYWNKLNQSEKIVLVIYMDMFYGAEFSKTFLKTANSKKRPDNIIHVTNIQYKNTPKKLEARGYHMAEVSYGLRKMEIWVHSNGNEVWLIHSIPSKTEKTEAKKETAKPPNKISEVQNPDSEYGGVKGESFNIELGPFNTGYAKLYNNGYIERFPSRHSRYVHTFVPVPGKPGEYYVYKNYKLQSFPPLGLFEGPNIIEIDISKFKNTYKN